uniref:G_PROTEIN_RECEP_F1_2 domain-containing protein n=1 Tax=Panagrellus redivivus TaxID=6233 RepID=A0A7E4UTE8_PANRE
MPCLNEAKAKARWNFLNNCLIFQTTFSSIASTCLSQTARVPSVTASLVGARLLGLTDSPVGSELASNYSTLAAVSRVQSSCFLSLATLLQTLVTAIEDIQPMLSQFLNGYLTLFCVSSGIVLNILCIYVFLKYRSGSPVIQYYLVTLTLWQTALLCNAFLLYCLPTLIFGHIVSRGYYVYLYPFVYTFANTTHTGTVWIILTLTIDRYLALCQPLKHRAIGKRSRVKRLMVAVSLLAVIFSLPRFFEVTTVDCDFYNETTDASLNDCLPQVARTTLVDDQTYWTVYHIVLSVLFVTFVPCLLLFALTLRISIALRRAITRRKALCAPTSDLDGRNKKNACSKKEHRANVMLILVIAKFLVSDVLPAIIDVLEHIVGSGAFMQSSLATLFVDISNFLLVLNCSTNFWIFLFWGKRFRRSCRHMMMDTTFGRMFYTWVKFNDSELASYFGQPSSATTNYTRTRNGIYSEHRTAAKKSFAPGESTVLLLSSENGLLQEPLLKAHKKYSTNGTAPKKYSRQEIGRCQRQSFAAPRQGPGITPDSLHPQHNANGRTSSLEIERNAMLKFLANEKRH